MLELFLAFGAGLISFLSPCVLPLIPGYVSYVTGTSLKDLTESKIINLIPIILFTIGFSIVFILFGAAATFIGKFLLTNSYQLRIIAGIIIIFFSLQILGFISLSFLNYEKRFYTNKNVGFFSPVLVGLAFGFGCLIDRSYKVKIKHKIISQVKLKIPTYSKKNLPYFIKNKPVTKPGSRFLK